ncbi:MAG TPA: hypothetical protein VLG76_05775 [Rhabdochlamydiaceae bacterium]|nr:hypothetical protein [Rhabdochlamydiaceae bacterium]
MENIDAINSGFSYKQWLQPADAQVTVTDADVTQFFKNITSSFNTLMQQDQSAAQRSSARFKDIYQIT